MAAEQDQLRLERFLRNYRKVPLTSDETRAAWNYRMIRGFTLKRNAWALQRASLRTDGRSLFLQEPAPGGWSFYRLVPVRPSTARDARPSWKDTIQRAHHKEQNAKRISKLKADLRAARITRDEALRGARSYCASLRRTNKAYHEACADRRRKDAESWAPRLDKAITSLDEERKLQAFVHRHESRARAKTQYRSTSTERRQESDDEVRRNIPSELHPLWKQVKGSIKGGPRKSRTEAFLQYAEEHPREVLDVDGIEDATERMIREHERSLRRTAADRDPLRARRRRRR